MAEQEADQQDKTEAPSQRRLQRARDEGQVPISRELTTFASLTAGCVGLMLIVNTTGKNVTLQLAGILGNIDSPSLAGATGLRMAGSVAAMVIVVAVLPAIFATLTVLLQSRLALRWSALRLKFDHLNPIAGARRILSRASLVEAGKSILKVIVVGLILWNLRRSFEPIAQLSLQSARSIASSLFQTVYVTALSVLAFQALMAAVDLIWVRIRHTKQLRMSKHDLREEMKETDGDPKIKARLRQLRMQRAKKRMMAQVATATVVITNPTHYAVALQYDKQKNAAPRVVAKGADEVAARIRKAAEDSAVPVVSNPLLARALFLLPLDAEIASEQYQAVAEVIAYVWKLKTRVRGGP